MPFQPAPGVAEVVVRFKEDEQTILNVYHAFIGTGWTTILLNDLAIDVRNYIEGTMLPSMSNGVQLQDVTVTDIGSEAGGQVIVPPSGAGFGGTESEQLPNNVTLAVKWLTAIRGRSFRGRTYHIGLTESEVTKNRVNAAFLAALVTQYTGLKNVITDDPIRQMCVLSRFHLGAPREEAICTPINALAIDGTVDSQRRRLPGRGN
jgi:hypothetical protein